jgi:cytochrome bd-type quinol oxidase subunit 2
MGTIWFCLVAVMLAAYVVLDGFDIGAGIIHLSSCAYLLGMLTSVAFSLYPRVLPASTKTAFALTVENAKAPEHGLRVGVAWWLVGMALVAAYSIYSYRSFAGKVKLPTAEEGY